MLSPGPFLRCAFLLPKQLKYIGPFPVEVVRQRKRREYAVGGVIILDSGVEVLKFCVNAATIHSRASHVGVDVDGRRQVSQRVLKFPFLQIDMAPVREKPVVARFQRDSRGEIDQGFIQTVEQVEHPAPVTQDCHVIGSK